MEEIQAILAQFTALDAALYVLVMPGAVLLRFLRAWWHGFGNRATILSAFVFGVAGTAAASYDAPAPRPALWVLTQFVSLMVALLLAELGARKIPALPKDDQIADVKHLMPEPSRDAP